MYDAGKLFRRDVVETVPVPRLGLPESPVQPGFRPLEQFNESYESDSEDGGDFDPEDCEEDDFSFKRLVDCLTECFDRFCFLHGSFDSSTFISLAQTFFPENGNENFSLTKDRFMLLKGKVISFVMKKVFVILALTKTQIDKLNAFFQGRFVCHGKVENRANISTLVICRAFANAKGESIRETHLSMKLSVNATCSPLLWTQHYLGKSMYCLVSGDSHSETA